MSDGTSHQPTPDPGAFQRIDSDFRCAVSFSWPDPARPPERGSARPAAAPGAFRDPHGAAPQQVRPAEPAYTRMRPASAPRPDADDHARFPATGIPPMVARGEAFPIPPRSSRRRADRRRGSALYSGMPVALALAAGTLSIGLLLGGALLLDELPGHGARPPLASPLLPRLAGDAGVATPWRQPAPLREAVPDVPPAQQASAPASPPVVPATLVLHPAPAPMPARLASQDLREAADEAYRRGNFSAAAEFYDRALQALRLENGSLAAPEGAAPSAGADAPPTMRLEEAVVTLPSPVAEPQPETRPILAAPQPVPQPVPTEAPRLPPAVHASLMRNGDAALQRGDISGARALYQRAASLDGAAAAALVATGKTYDPGILAGLGVHGGALPDAAAAARWYERAQALGDPTAGELLNRLR
ncbi:hypothetical protein [Belnapia sp. F-4-1]|uniref:hypothetical protein n=1 Tax=Belnapia sp. F-4-1 TaxID=1545443 RepID=UPI0005BB21CF|nr:hypothetical protein [Belnapia sp. F-4-1]